MRLVSILDNYDSAIDNDVADTLPFRAVINDLYAKDISKKIKASKHKNAVMAEIQNICKQYLDKKYFPYILYYCLCLNFRHLVLLLFSIFFLVEKNILHLSIVQFSPNNYI